MINTHFEWSLAELNSPVLMYEKGIVIMQKIFLDKDENLFSYVVDTFRSSANISLGKIKNPVTNKIDVNLVQAEYYLDVLSMLQKKTKNNLTEYE